MIFPSFDALAQGINTSALKNLDESHYRHRVGFLHNFSKEVIAENIVSCKIQEGKKCVQAGNFWDDFWVRDISYSTLMGLWKLYPEELKNTYKEMVLQNKPHPYPKQDASADFGEYPYQTDSLLWVIGAFHLAKKTDDLDFRNYVFHIAKNMEHRFRTVVNWSDELIVGAPSFLDTWVFFPKSWQGKHQKLITHKFLSTNVIWARFHEILLHEGLRIGEYTQEQFNARKQRLRRIVQSINQKFYKEDKQYYSYFQGSDRYELLGNLLLEHFGYHYYPIEHVQLASGFYPVIYPYYENMKTPKEGNWYTGVSQFIWVDTLAAKITGQSYQTMSNKYFDHINNYMDIKEMIRGDEMLGWNRQLWGATALWHYFEPLYTRKVANSQ